MTRGSLTGRAVTPFRLFESAWLWNNPTCASLMANLTEAKIVCPIVRNTTKDNATYTYLTISISVKIGMCEHDRNNELQVQKSPYDER